MYIIPKAKPFYESSGTTTRFELAGKWTTDFPDFVAIQRDGQVIYKGCNIEDAVAAGVNRAPRQFAVLQAHGNVVHNPTGRLHYDVIVESDLIGNISRSDRSKLRELVVA